MNESSGVIQSPERFFDVPCSNRRVESAREQVGCRPVEYRHTPVMPNELGDRFRIWEIHNADRIVGSSDRDQTVFQRTGRHQFSGLHVHPSQYAIARLFPLNEAAVFAAGVKGLSIIRKPNRENAVVMQVGR